MPLSSNSEKCTLMNATIGWTHDPARLINHPFLTMHMMSVVTWPMKEQICLKHLNINVLLIDYMDCWRFSHLVCLLCLLVLPDFLFLVCFSNGAKYKYATCMHSNMICMFGKIRYSFFFLVNLTIISGSVWLIVLMHSGILTDRLNVLMLVMNCCINAFM